MEVLEQVTPNVTKRRPGRPPLSEEVKAERARLKAKEKMLKKQLRAERRAERERLKAEEKHENKIARKLERARLKGINVQDESEPVRRKYKPREVKELPTEVSLQNTKQAVIVKDIISKGSILDSGVQILSVGSNRQTAVCQCKCGVTFSANVDHLISGVINSCNKCDPWFDEKIPVEALARYVIISNFIGCNIGIAKSYVDRKYDLYLAYKAYAMFTSNNLSKFHHDKKRERLLLNMKIGHSRLTSKTPRHIWINGTREDYYQLTCECGFDLLAKESDILNSKMPICRCNLLSEKFTLDAKHNPEFSEIYQKVLNEYAGDRLINKVLDEFNLDICRYGADKEGMCNHYTRHCLSDLADYRFPRKYRIGYTCYSAQDLASNVSSSDRIMRSLLGKL